MARENKRNWPRTIDPKLHKVWLRLRRKGDPETLAKELGCSRPVIDRALIYGYVSMPEIPDLINAFFKKRLDHERKAAAELTGAEK